MNKGGAASVSKTTLLDSRIKKYAYREAAQIYKDIGASPDGLPESSIRCNLSCGAVLLFALA